MTSTDPNRLTNGGARGFSDADRRIAPDPGIGAGATGVGSGSTSGPAQGGVGLQDSGRGDGTGQPRRVRLAILDDHEVLLDSLSSWIAVNAYDFDLALTAHTWLEMVHSDSFPTDLVFLDFQLKEPVSIEARVRTCRAAGAKVIVLSSVDTRESRDRAVQAGAAAFLSKSLPMREVMDVAREVMGVARESTPQRDWRPLPTGAAGHQRPKLSHGEEEALRLYVSGFSTNEVAAQMNVQYETAKTYLRRVREKYGKVGRPASKKSDLIRRAAEDGYLQ